MKILTDFDGRELTESELQQVRGGESQGLPLLDRGQGKHNDKDRDCDCDRDRNWGWDDYDDGHYGYYRYYRRWRGDDYYGDC